MRIFLIIVAAAFAVPANAAVMLTSASYQQDFNTLASTGTSSSLPTGWSIAEGGANANAIYTASTGSNATGDTYSFGTAGSNERALGGVASANLFPRYGVQFTNGLGRTITSLDLAYVGELWRVGTAGNLNTLSFAWSLDATSLTTGTYTNFTALNFAIAPTGATGLRDGNLNQTAIAGTISGLSVAPGASFFLRWSGADAAGNDAGLAIDNFSLNATTAVPEPASWAMLIAGFGLVGAAARRRRARHAVALA
jgi:hypothetical protein